MSFMKPAQKDLAPETAAEPPKDAAPKEKAPLPEVVLFTVVKRDRLFSAIAIKVRGHEVTGTTVLETDDMRSVALDAFDKASREYIIHKIDPFREEKDP